MNRFFVSYSGDCPDVPSGISSFHLGRLRIFFAFAQI